MNTNQYKRIIQLSRIPNHRRAETIRDAMAFEFGINRTVDRPAVFESLMHGFRWSCTTTGESLYRRIHNRYEKIERGLSL